MKDFFLKKQLYILNLPKSFANFNSLLIETKKSHTDCKIANITDPEPILQIKNFALV